MVDGPLVRPGGFPSAIYDMGVYIQTPGGLGREISPLKGIEVDSEILPPKECPASGGRPNIFCSPAQVMRKVKHLHFKQAQEDPEVAFLSIDSSGDGTDSSGDSTNTSCYFGFPGPSGRSG